MCPVNNCHLSILSYDYVTRIEITVADLIMLRHTLKTCHQFITGCSIQVFQSVNLTCQFIFHALQQRRVLALYFELQCYKIIHIFCKILLIGFHHFFQCLAFFIFNHDCPFPIDLGYFFYLWNIQSCLFHTCCIQCLIKYIWLWMSLCKYFYDTVVTLIYCLIWTLYDDIFFF